MIRNREKKLNEIIKGIHHQVYRRIDEQYRHGPSLYFYGKIIDLRREAGSLSVFFDSVVNTEYLYATLGLWDMNTRGANMKDFDPFMKILQKNKRDLLALESMFPESIGWMDSSLKDRIGKALHKVYLGMKLMKTKRRLVSNSKILHFMFPDFLMPMDNNHTLKCLTSGESAVGSESWKKYWEITEFAFDVMHMVDGRDVKLDDGFNKSLPKIVDNVIILSTRNNL